MSKENKIQPTPKFDFEPIKPTTMTFVFYPNVEVEEPHSTKNDKRYETPFEDDGAYAD